MTQVIHQQILLCLSFIFCACSASPPPPPPSPSTILELEGLLIRGKGEVISPSDLFNRGIGAFQGQKFKKCEEDLVLYLAEFSNAVHAHAAHYNLGLCLEMQHKYRLAAEQFKEYAVQSTKSVDQIDGEVRWGYNLLYSGQAQTAVKIYTRILTEKNVIGFDRAECHLRRAMAYMLLKKYAEADRDLDLTLGHINSNIGRYREGNELLAEAHFQQGELYRRYMAEVILKMPLPRMKRLMMDKIRFFRKSQHFYVSCIHIHHSYWATAAGHQLAVLHENIYQDIMNAEHPEEFDDETSAYYYFELDKKLVPLIRESILIYEKTTTLSATQGVQNEWVTSTNQNLKRLRLLEESIQYRLTLDPIKAYKIRIAELAKIKKNKSSHPYTPFSPQSVSPHRVVIRDQIKEGQGSRDKEANKEELMEKESKGEESKGEESKGEESKGEESKGEETRDEVLDGGVRVN